MHKVNTKINPGDLNTKRLGSERRSFLGRLVGLFVPSDEEKNDDSTVRQIRRLNQMTREHVVRLVQMAGITMNMCMQLKGCEHDGGTDSGIDDFQMVLWTVVESTLGWLLAVPHFIFMVCIWILFLMVQVAGILTLLAAVVLVIGGPLIWRDFRALQGFSTRNAPWFSLQMVHSTKFVGFLVDAKRDCLPSCSFSGCRSTW